MSNPTAVAMLCLFRAPIRILRQASLFCGMVNDVWVSSSLLGASVGLCTVGISHSAVSPHCVAEHSSRSTAPCILAYTQDNNTGLRSAALWCRISVPSHFLRNGSVAICIFVPTHFLRNGSVVICIFVPSHFLRNGSVVICIFVPSHF